MPNRYAYAPDLHLVVERFEGALRIDDIIAMKTAQAEDGITAPHLRALVHASDTTFEIEPRETERLADFFHESVTQARGARFAFLIDEARATALTLLWEHRVEDMASVEIYTSIHEALVGLGISFSDLTDEQHALLGPRTADSKDV